MIKSFFKWYAKLTTFYRVVFSSKNWMGLISNEYTLTRLPFALMFRYNSGVYALQFGILTFNFTLSYTKGAIHPTYMENSGSKDLDPGETVGVAKVKTPPTSRSRKWVTATATSTKKVVTKKLASTPVATKKKEPIKKVKPEKKSPPVKKKK